MPTFMLVYFSILLLGIVIGLVKYNKLNKSSRIFLLLLFISLLSESLAEIIRKKEFFSNFFIYHFFIPIEYCLIAWAYFEQLKYRYILLSIPIMVVIAIFLSTYVQPITEFNSNYLSLSLLLYFVLAILYLVKLLKINTDKSLKDYPLFWISCGWLLFSASNLFVFGTYNTFFKGIGILEQVFSYIRIITNYILYLLFIVAFLVKQHNLLENERK